MWQAAQARAGAGPSRPTLYLRILFFEFLFLGIVIVGVRLRGASLSTIFGKRWHSAGEILRDVGLGACLLVAATILASVLGSHEGPAANDAIRYLVPRDAFELWLWMAVSLAAGVCEEAIFRGYLQRQFSALTRSVPVGIVLSAAAFGASHLYQGWGRAAVIAVPAVLFGWVAHWRKTVRPGMIAHTLQDGLAPLLLKLVRG